MLFISNLECRGVTKKVDSENRNHFYLSLEGEDGESCKFPVKIVDFEDKFKLKKGDKVKVFLDFSVKYGSFNIVNLELINK